MWYAHTSPFPLCTLFLSIFSFVTRLTSHLSTWQPIFQKTKERRDRHAAQAADAPVAKPPLLSRSELSAAPMKGRGFSISALLPLLALLEILASKKKNHRLKISTNFLNQPAFVHHRGPVAQIQAADATRYGVSSLARSGYGCH